MLGLLQKFAENIHGAFALEASAVIRIAMPQNRPAACGAGEGRDDGDVVEGRDRRTMSWRMNSHDVTLRSNSSMVISSPTPPAAR